jgi:hypothetical protein
MPVMITMLTAAPALFCQFRRKSCAAPQALRAVCRLLHGDRDRTDDPPRVPVCTRPRSGNHGDAGSCRDQPEALDRPPLGG